MKDLARTAALAACVLLPGCSDKAAVTEPVAPATIVAGSSGCYTVTFAALLTPISDFSYLGPVTGDLIGTARVDFDEIGPFRGVTLSNAADAAWSITGGIVPELIGETFQTRLENRNVFLPGTSLVTNVGKLRAIAGVEQANLTYLGEYSFVTNQANHEYKGVVCP